MNRSLWLLLAIATHGCGTSSPPAPVSTPEASAPTPPAAASTDAPLAAAPLEPTAVPSAPADEDAPPKPPPASTTRKAALKDQVKGTPLAVLYVTDAAAATCGDAKPAEGATMLEATIFWKPGFYEIGTKTKTAAVKVREFSGGKWKSLPDAVTGDVQVRDAPVEPGKTGRIHLRTERAGKVVEEELDVLVCVAVAPPKSKGK